MPVLECNPGQLSSVASHRRKTHFCLASLASRCLMCCSSDAQLSKDGFTDDVAHHHKGNSTDHVDHHVKLLVVFDVSHVWFLLAFRIILDFQKMSSIVRSVDGGAGGGAHRSNNRIHDGRHEMSTEEMSHCHEDAQEAKDHGHAENHRSNRGLNNLVHCLISPYIQNYTGFLDDVKLLSKYQYEFRF